MSARSIGLLGGTFDPVHCAHLAFARAALDALALDAVRFVPAGLPWQKTRAVTPAAQRVAMLQLAIRDEPRFVLDTIEVDRAGPSYTVDTVRALQTAEPDVRWTLLLGQDQYAALHSWHEADDLLWRVTLAVAERPGAPPRLLDVPHAAVPMAPMAVSATDIRARAARGEPIDHLVPPAVAHYIEEHRLYQSGHGS